MHTLTFTRLADNAYRIALDGKTLLRAGYWCSFTGADEADAIMLDELFAEDYSVVLRDTFTADERDGTLFLTLTLTSGGSDPATLATMTPLLAMPEEGWQRGWSVWVQGREMRSATLAHRLGERHPTLVSGPGEPRDTLAGRFLDRGDRLEDGRSASMTVLRHESSGLCLLLGFVNHGRQESTLSWTAHPGRNELLTLRADTALDGFVLDPGASVASETLMIAAGDDPWELVARYADETARRMGARVPAATPTGWCSWYYFYNRVTEEDVRANLAALQASPARVDYVQIDDGYQAATGDWLTPNAKFPSGMAALARDIAAAGFRPGLWLAPFTLHEHSRTFQAHPDWAVRDEQGDILWHDMWLGRCATLDVTVPAAHAWLAAVIGTVVRDWGYTFLKLDALYMAARAGARYHAPNTTSAAHLRLGLETIRQAAGDDTFILGCSCPFGPAIGLVDAMRVGPDVEANWFNGTHPSAKHALRLALPRGWMHRRFWLNDPDCLTVRANDSTLTLEEARFVATGVALSGGPVVLSDDLATLDPERRDLARRVLPPTGVAAQPLDLFARETPAVWRLRRRHGRLIVAVLNWDDTPLTVTLRWEDLGISGPHWAREQWTDADLGRHDAALTLPDVPPHAARVLLLDPARPPPATRHLFGDD